MMMTIMIAMMMMIELLFLHTRIMLIMEPIGGIMVMVYILKAGGAVSRLPPIILDFFNQYFRVGTRKPLSLQCF